MSDKSVQHPTATQTFTVRRVEKNRSHLRRDVLITESPLEIRLIQEQGHRRIRRSISVTMRTPGQDEALAAGFLFTEGLIGKYTDIVRMDHPPIRWQEAENVLDVHLRTDLNLDWSRTERHFYTSSSCGVCGKGSLELVRTQSVYLLPPETPQVSPHLVMQLPAKLRQQQALFAHTGGVHAVGLFRSDGELLHVQEDVGRHNAMDKVVGSALRNGQLPLREHIGVLSGRASFELVQKAAMAGIPLLIAVGAPSSLAVELAEEQGMTLVGFAGASRFNVYSGFQRIGSLANNH